jgi:hypothetical protein
MDEMVDLPYKTGHQLPVKWMPVAADRKLTQVFNCFCSLFEQENTG